MTLVFIIYRIKLNEILVCISQIQVQLFKGRNLLHTWSNLADLMKLIGRNKFSSGKSALKVIACVFFNSVIIKHARTFCIIYSRLDDVFSFIFRPCYAVWKFQAVIILRRLLSC
jgi:hypothetical protein